MSKLSGILRSAGLVAILLAPLACGGPDAPSSRATARVKGKVTRGGRPLAQVEVTFNPSNVNRKDAPIATAPLKEDGTYEVTTLVGQNQVTLSGPGTSNKPQLSYFSKAFEVQSGTNELDLEFP